jgi:hypothetical protein
MDFQFHCSKRAAKCVKKSKHRLGECCGDVMKVLTTNPEYGALIRNAGGLRKMRVHVPTLHVGKSGGYRLIYRPMMVDEVWKIALLAAYFKGDCEDLSQAEYDLIALEAEAIFNDCEGHFAWESA